LNELFEIANLDFLQWLKDNWEILFKRVRRDFDIQGSPERTLSRAVIEDRKGRLFLLEKFSKEKFFSRQKVAQTIAHLNTNGLIQALGGERTINKEFLPFFQENCFQVSPFLDSSGIERPEWLASSQIGKNMALFLIQMANASSSFPTEISLDHFSIKAYIYKLFTDMKKHNIVMYDRYSPFLGFLEQGFMDVHDRLPLKFSHGDFHPLNVIWDHHRIKAVIDWEFLGFKPDIYDSANLVGCAGIENPEGLAMPMVTTFLREIRAAKIISSEGWQYFPEYILAVRFAWLSEWLRKKDQEMLEMEAAFMDILIKNIKDLRYIWEI